MRIDEMIKDMTLEEKAAIVAGTIGSSMVKGIQKNGTGVSVKHFALNNSENFRFMGDHP